MSVVELLDCTLRDGAYLIDKKFGDNVIKGIIEGLVKSKLEYIEIGFFQDDGFGEGKTVYKNSADAKKFIPKNKNGSMFTVLADFSRYSVDNLDECSEDSIDAVRECFFKHERFGAIEACKKIKSKGYKVFVQPVDILGYTEEELIEFIKMVNEVQPYCLSIVDTFGSMFQEDLHRVFKIIDENLVSSSKIGFHSHNNMQLSNALSQEFVRIISGKREGIIDGTISGMGRGAGNTPTELIAQYLNCKYNRNYDMDILLDIIDDYMDNIKAKCTWGYNTPYFIAGCYGAHVNNIQYLTQKNSIRSKSIRYILNKIGGQARKRYDYDLLEKTYLDFLSEKVDENMGFNQIKKVMLNKNILVIAPGSSIVEDEEKIFKYIETYNPVVISVSFVPNNISPDYVYMSNTRRYVSWKDLSSFKKVNKIIASNIKQERSDETENIVSFAKLVKKGSGNIDNSTLMVLRLLDLIGVKSIALAGFDGYDYSPNNYASVELELNNVREDPNMLNKQIEDLLKDYIENRKNNIIVSFITPSKFEKIFN